MERRLAELRAAAERSAESAEELRAFLERDAERSLLLLGTCREGGKHSGAVSGLDWAAHRSVSCL